jgi:hypothetical protein
MVLHLDPDNRVVILTEIPGRTLSHAVVTAQLVTCRQVGPPSAQASSVVWNNPPPALTPHTVQRELAILSERAAHAAATVAEPVRDPRAGETTAHDGRQLEAASRWTPVEAMIAGVRPFGWPGTGAAEGSPGPGADC